MVINTTGFPPPPFRYDPERILCPGSFAEHFLHPQRIKDYEFSSFCICITQYIYFIKFSK
jgi:hypothetical protein